MAGLNKQTTFNPYPQAMLPEGFSYPQSYLKLSKDTSTINCDSEYMFPWWFEDYNPERRNIAYELRNTKIPNSNLTPLARNGDWAACFNANDTSGNPQVIVIDLGNTKNIEYFSDFNEWLEAAEQDGWG